MRATSQRPSKHAMRCVISTIVCCSLWSATSRAADQISVHDIPTRPAVTVRVLVIKPDLPIATILLFPGGIGRVSFQPDGGTSYRGFPVRTPKLFVHQGFMTAVINAPSDRLPSPAMNFFREAAAHAEDVQHVIAFLRKQANVPLWLVGHSAGSTSVATAAIRLREGGPDGIVLISSKNGKYDRASANLDGLDIEEITVPALVVHHEQDECAYTLFRNTQRLMARLKKTARSELVPFKGGGPVDGDACGSLHYHGFPGIEQDVAFRIGDWIKTTLKH